MEINFILPGIGVSGGSRAIFEISDRLEKRGHEVRIVFPFLPPGYFLEDERSWLNIRKVLGAFRRSRRSEPDWFEFNSNAEFKRIPSLYPTRYFENSVPDADISIATAWQTAEFVANLADSKGEKYYFVQHYEVWKLWENRACWNLAKKENPDIPSLGMVNIEPKKEEFRQHKSKVDRTYSLPLSKIVTSSWEEAVMSELGEEYVGSVDIGIEMEPIDKDYEENIEILALYRGKDHKGDNQVLSSFKQLNSKFQDVRFVMFGSKPENLPGFIEFHNNPKDEKMTELYSRADLLIYPSWVEGWGMPPMEAMACKTGLVSTDVGAVDDYTPEGGVEFVPVRDSEAIAEKVDELLDDEERIENMKQKNYEYIQEYTWENTVNQFEELIS
jgi:glycosyltransferase involved in cell wall biosynthesis